ncbi:hypothetical protein FS749_013475 [Ceratobasidium sp. UAMH 11750]|nr:hypothetical protein FS749_013475 [Ceratobasidium sp. UAMH 11750]
MQFLHDSSVNNSKRLHMLMDVARGLSHIHSLSIVHGDLKASNVVVGDKGEIAKICDFGSSCIACDCYDGPRDQPGTVQWDSPEVREDAPRSSSSDVWAFGCLALEVQFDQFPYHINDRKAVLMQLKGFLPATERSVALENNPLSKHVWDIMQKCWELNPLHRPNASGVLTDLEALKSNVESFQDASIILAQY